MQPVKAGLRSKLVGDATLIGAANLNGQHVYYGRSEVPIVPKWITFQIIFSQKDEDVPLKTLLVQFDLWGRGSNGVTFDDMDLIADRVEALLDKGTIPTASMRVALVLKSDDREDYEEDTQLYHRIQTYQVFVYPS